MNTEQRQQLWDRFLNEWPVERIASMTLAQYVSVNDKSTFTYWLETEAKSLGSIKGGSSEKFGIYKRADPSKRNGRNNYSHDDTYTWHSKYGEDASTAFARIKQSILDAIKAVKANDLDAIEVIDIAPTLKWKVAFIYQNRSKPSVLNIYKAPVLRRAVKNSKATMAQAYNQLLDNKPDDVSIFDYYSEIWASNQAATEQEIEQLIESMNMDAVNNLSNTKLQQLYELTEWAHDAGLDIYPVNIGNQFRIGRKGLNSAKSDAAFKLVTVQKSKIKLGDANYSLEYLATCEEEKDKFAEQYVSDREGYWPVDYTKQHSSSEETENNNEESEMTTSSLNQILYGPPGTGKTYHTIEAAVKAAEPSFTWATRTELKEEYDRLVADKRIRFVTFHQSYGYEEFVEGLRAESDSDGNLSYPIKDGVFKSISDEASAQNVEKPKNLSEDARIWQLSIESSGYSEVKQYCLDNNIGAIGWGHVGDMTPTNRTQEINNELANETHPNQATIRHFCNGMAIGDVVLCVSGQKTIEAIGVVSGDYEFWPDGVHTREDYCHVRPIKWLAKGLELNVYDLNGQTRLPIKTCSELTRFSVPELLTLLSKNKISLGNGVTQEVQRYVLVIDEINRGNISKVFGELITVIEPTKRSGKGQNEAITLNLPYSGKPFSVPKNLHIIGTMNTADRSLTKIDTALRRRFDFVEMMPKPELFENKQVNGIDLTRLLKTLNDRISVLIDREHTLGHAFLYPAYNALQAGDEAKAFLQLKAAFKNKILPLLQEYFFEDWNKISLVLGDNQKDESLCFVRQLPTSYSQLFGSNHGLDTYEDSATQFTLASFEGADSVWDDAEAYIAIYDHEAVKGSSEQQVASTQS